MAKDFVVLNGRIIKPGESFGIYPFIKNEFQKLSQYVEFLHTVKFTDGIVPLKIKTSVSLINTDDMPRDYKLFQVSAKIFLRGVIYNEAVKMTLAEFLQKALAAKEERNGYLDRNKRGARVHIQ